jgi:hypothetical protein
VLIGQVDDRATQTFAAVPRTDGVIHLKGVHKPIRIDVREGGGYVISRLAINPADSVPEITSTTAGETLRDAIDDILITRDA